MPTGVFEPTVTVINDAPAPGAAMALGLKLTLVPVGAPEAVKATELLKPPPIVVAMSDVPCVPCARASDGGVAETAKLGCPDVVTVTLTTVVSVSPPPNPLMTIG